MAYGGESPWMSEGFVRPVLSRIQGILFMLPYTEYTKKTAPARDSRKL